MCCNNHIVRQRAGSRDEMQWSPFYWRSVNSKDTGWPRLTLHHRGEWNEWDECGEIVEWNLWQEKMRGTRRKTYSDSVSSTMKSRWSDRDANSRSQRSEACVQPLAQRSRILNVVPTSNNLANSKETNRNEIFSRNCTEWSRESSIHRKIQEYCRKRSDFKKKCTVG